MNAYADIAQFAARSTEDATTSVAEKLSVLELASRVVDSHCNRTFYARTETRYYSTHFEGFILVPFDLISLTAAALDVDQDGVFELAVPTTEYVLEPYKGPPYFRIRFRPASVYGGYIKGQPKGAELTGLWGYKSTQSTLAVTLGADLTDSGTTLQATDGTVQAGQTLVIGSEELYVSDRASAGHYTVERGVNGTTAAAHSTGAAIAKRTYPDEVKEATLVEAVRLWKRREMGFAERVVVPEVGSTAPMGAVISPVTKMLLKNLRRGNFVAAGGVS